MKKMEKGRAAGIDEVRLEMLDRQQRRRDIFQGKSHIDFFFKSKTITMFGVAFMLLLHL